MDIGPVRQRFTAEPVSSPVPGEPSAEPAIELVRDEPAPDGPTHVPAEPAR